MNQIRSLCLCGASAAAFFMPALAMAQTEPGAAFPASGPTVPTTSQAAPQGDATDSTPDATGGGVEEIVVSARRRNEKQQDVPIAISTVSANAAARIGISNTESVSIAVPGLQFSRQTGNGGAPFVRGVGSGSAAQGVSPAVAIYIDDVFIGAPSATTFSFNNIEQVSVLKGPQGTLFGRNATGGVVQIRTKRPSYDAALDASVGYSNFNTIDGSLYATTGLTDTLAVNFAVTGHNQQNGYGRNLLTGHDIYKSKSFGVRSEALWEPSTDTSLLLIADYSRSHGDVGQAAIIFPGTISATGAVFKGRYNASVFPDDESTSTQYGVSGRLDHDLGGVRVVSITAYRHALFVNNLDTDNTLPVVTGTQIRGPSHQFSEEVQLLSPQASKLQWIVGAYYFDGTNSYDPLAAIGSSQAALGGINNLYETENVKSYAGFGEVSYPVFANTRVTGGLRYTTDYFTNFALRTNASGQTVTGFPFTQKADFSKWTYRGVIDHHFTPDIMVYGSYSRGFRSGGYNTPGPTITVGGVVKPGPAVAPEVLDALEVGAKTEFFSRKLQFNIAAYKYSYSDLQVTVVGIGTSQTLNAASAGIRGLDLDFSARPISNLVLSGGVSFIHGRLQDFKNGTLFVPRPATCGPPARTTGPLTGGNLTCASDLSGNSTVRSPKFTGSFVATYTLPTAIGDLALTGSIYHNSGYFWDPDNRLKQPKYDLLNGTLSWTSVDRRYEARVFANNILNSYYYSYVSDTAGRDSGSPASPRTYGVAFSVHFF